MKRTQQYFQFEFPSALRPIRAFMDRKRADIDAYRVVDLAAVRVIDLVLRLGQPYLYQHQGDCEHLLIFTDLRLLTAADEQSLHEYPIRVFDNAKLTMCMTCKASAAE